MTRNPPGDGVWLVEKAIEMAVQAHANQKRKGTDQPYIVHPLSVGMLLMKHGYPEHLVIAGLLHDTLEDTDLTEEEIRRVFGDPVAELVRGCSEPDKSLPWEERKKHTLSYLQTAPMKCALLPVPTNCKTCAPWLLIMQRKGLICGAALMSERKAVLSTTRSWQKCCARLKKKQSRSCCARRWFAS